MANYRYNMEGTNYDNKSRISELNYNTMELGDIKSMPISDSATTSSSRTTTTATAVTQSDGSLTCNNGGCKSSFNRLAANESPWNLLKTVFLIMGIVAFIVWIIIYGLLSHYNIL